VGRKAGRRSFEGRLGWALRISVGVSDEFRLTSDTSYYIACRIARPCTLLDDVDHVTSAGVRFLCL